MAAAVATRIHGRKEHGLTRSRCVGHGFAAAPCGAHNCVCRSTRIQSASRRSVARAAPSSIRRSMRRAGRELLSLGADRCTQPHLGSARRPSRSAGAPASVARRTPDGRRAPLWLAGHVGWFAECWIGRNTQRAFGVDCPADRRGWRRSSRAPTAGGARRPRRACRAGPRMPNMTGARLSSGNARKHAGTARDTPAKPTPACTSIGSRCSMKTCAASS